LRWLGMTAAVATLVAVVMNSIWFVRRGLGLGGFISMVWPVALATAGVIAFAIGLGWLTVRAMLRASAEQEEGRTAQRQETTVAAADAVDAGNTAPVKGRGRSGPASPSREVQSRENP